MEFKCNVPSNNFIAGETSIAMINGSFVDTNDPTNNIIFVQIHGHISINEKWIKLPRDFSFVDHEVDNGSFFIDKVTKFPSDPISLQAFNSSKLIFTTSKVAVSSTQFITSGVVIECFLPKDLLPSYKGRSFQIQYYLSVFLHTSNEIYTQHLPIIICGQGSEEKIYKLKFGSISTYPANISFDKLVDSEIGLGIQRTKKLFSKNQIVKVSDEGLICKVLIESDSFPIGGKIPISFQFEGQEESCKAIRSTFVLIERALDGSTIQEKTLNQIMKNTLGAIEFETSFDIPPNLPFTFSSPVGSVSYVIIFEFFLEKSEEPLYFRYPIIITGSALNSNQQKFGCHLLRNCLESISLI